MTTLPHPQTCPLAKLATAARMRSAVWSTSVQACDVSTLRTDRLTLRPLRPTDRDEFIDAWRFSRWRLDEFFPLHRSNETADELFDRYLALAAAAHLTRRAYRWIICEPSSGIIGAVNLNDVTTGPRARAEINFWIASRATGQGFGSEAVRAVVDVALKPQPIGIGLTRVFGLVAPENLASIKLMENTGFWPAGASRHIELNIGGEWKRHVKLERHATMRNRILSRSSVLTALVG